VSEAADRVARRAQGLLERIAAPRFPGGEGERRCAEFIRAELAAAGFEVREEKFSFGRPDLLVRRLLGSAGLAGLAAAWLLREAAPLGAAAIVLGLLAASLLVGPIWLAVAWRLRAVGPSQSRNIIATRPGTSPTRYLCAHYDSKSQALPLVWRIALGLALSATLALLAALLLAAVPFPLWPLFALAAALALVLVWQGEGDASPGALDNGAAVALLLALAQEKADDGLPVGLVFFGAEELGLLGSIEFARRHPDARACEFVNLDGIGLAGRLRLFGGRTQPAGRLYEAAGRAGVALSASPLWPGLLMDHVALRRAGLAAVSLGCVGGPSLRIHSAADTPALVELEGLREAAALLLECEPYGRERPPAPPAAC